MILDKYKDKSILIIGGGTSSLDVQWENLDYDFIWTCNEFYLEPRVLSKKIDLYILSHTVNLSNTGLISKLRGSSTTVLFEPLHFRNKTNSREFREFISMINTEVVAKNLQLVKRPAGMSGVAFRLILLALQTQAKNIFFSGFDGFNKHFSNVHAFTKHPGLKSTDTRRTFEGTRESYKTIFTDAYNWFLKQPGYERLQNLGEGFDYNIGTPISKKYFPLKNEVYEKIK